MLRVSSREYKVMLDHRMFEDRKPAVASFYEELRGSTKRLRGVGIKGLFNQGKKREIVFLDARDQTINLNRFVFILLADCDGKPLLPIWLHRFISARLPWVCDGGSLTRPNSRGPESERSTKRRAMFEVRVRSKQNSVESARRDECVSLSVAVSW